MKRVLGIVLIIQLLLSIVVVNASVVTNTNITGIQMLMDGTMVNFKVAQLNINDQLIQSDVPPVIHNDRTLVPLRVIIENIKADVNWNQVTQEVTVKTADKVIVLQIKNPVAKVNGDDSNLPDGVAPMLINGRTMVPIRFVAETLGIGVNWDSKTQTVFLKHKEVVIPENVIKATAITVGQSSEIRIKTSKEVEYQTSTLSNPNRLIVDLKNVSFELEDKRHLLGDGSYRLAVTTGPVKVIRASQRTQPLETRVVLEMEELVTHKIYYDQITGEMVISFSNNVKSVKIDQHNMKEVVVIEGDNVKNYNVSRLQNPERLVVDILDAEISTPTYKIDVDGRVAKSIRVAKFDPLLPYKADDKIVRVVIDLQDLISYEDFIFEVKNNQLIVHLEGKPYNSLSYETVGWTTSSLIFRGSTASQYQVKALTNNVLEVLIPKNNMAIEFNDIAVGDHMVKSITVDGNNNNEHHRILIEMANEVQYQMISPIVAKDLELEFKNTNKYREILVIIDPGHGGTDPGAISTKLKLKESDLVLDISLRLNKLLTGAGFRTYMTRSATTTISLQDRALIANQLKGDLFVSVHANAAGNTSAEGIENLYYPSENDPNDSRDNKRLAQTFQTTMISDLGARNRGIVQRDKIYVLRETKMPAVLTEVGFLSNSGEEAKLATEAYRQRIAESLFKSIVKYFEETRL